VVNCRKESLESFNTMVHVSCIGPNSLIEENLLEAIISVAASVDFVLQIFNSMFDAYNLLTYQYIIC